MSNWILMSIGAAVSFGFMAVLITQAIKNGLNLATAMLIMATSWLIYFGYNLKNDGVGLINSKNLIFAIIAALLTIVGNQWQFTAMKLAPNPGLASAVIGGQIIVATLAALIFCGDAISLRQGLGIVICLVGISLIALK